MDTFLTILEPSEGLYKEKMSKFLSFAEPITSVEEAMERIAWYQKAYFDARHVCWAYMLGTEHDVFRSNDNGEPSGTAGKPILGQINSANLTNILIVVVRYFGGIKLGTSGLIVAYREAAADAITNAKIEERHEMSIIKILFPYLAMNDVMRLVKDDSVKIIEQQFDNECRMSLTVRADMSESLTSALVDAGSTIL